MVTSPANAGVPAQAQGSNGRMDAGTNYNNQYSNAPGYTGSKQGDDKNYTRSVRSRNNSGTAGSVTAAAAANSRGYHGHGSNHYQNGNEEVLVHNAYNTSKQNRAPEPGGRARSSSHGNVGNKFKNTTNAPSSSNKVSRPPAGDPAQPPPPGASTASQSQGQGSNAPLPSGSMNKSGSQISQAGRDISSQYPPTRRPAYLLHRDLVIGKGSYGQVCIASRGEAEGGRHGKRKKFACKCVMLRSDPKYIAKLQEEVNVLRELRGHENVIRLYDVFCVDNELFIITELGRGGDLFHLLTTHPKHGVTEAYAAKTVAQMLSAVAFLHNRNICHRDLKLENWVLESGKDVWSPLKLIDFGLSTHFTPGHKLSRVVGSSYYVAPEVLKKSYTESCDLWSLGVIVYMLLSGAPPFYGRTDEAIKASIVNGEYTFPHELFRDVSDDAMAFVSTLLSYNTEYRYTAEQALTHPWLAANLDTDQLQLAKDGAHGTYVHPTDQPEPMQM